MSEIFIETINQKVIDIINIYKYPNSKINLSKINHMIQCAMEAEKNNEPDYIILACLLHGIGQLFDENYNDNLHTNNFGIIASNYLMNIGMNSRICYLVEKHIDAKRYLFTINNDDYHKLSISSKKKLDEYGGKMTEEEIFKIEQDEEYFNILKISKYYDIKKINKKILDIDIYIPLIKKYLKY